MFTDIMMNSLVDETPKKYIKQDMFHMIYNTASPLHLELSYIRKLKNTSEIILID